MLMVVEVDEQNGCAKVANFLLVAKQQSKGLDDSGQQEKACFSIAVVVTRVVGRRLRSSSLWSALNDLGPYVRTVC